MGYEIMEKLNLINKNIETCRLYGVDLEELLKRGSQFKVEAIIS
jgi:FtsZ-binding cell division protein ZapB